MEILFLRHAKAGNRRKWEGPDRLRPLSRAGGAQAEALGTCLAPYEITRVMTSPLLRCVQTVEPLAARLGVAVEERDELAEGTGADPTLALLRELAGTSALLCSHGDVMIDVLDALAAWAGLPLPDQYPLEKGATWVLEGDAFPFTGAVYLPAPA
ncbi:MAG: SixA phosphatase family protein [Acidimicrobiia bacterium]